MKNKSLQKSIDNFNCYPEDRMSFEKYAGRRFLDIPEEYLNWLNEKADIDLNIRDKVNLELQRRKNL